MFGRIRKDNLIARALEEDLYEVIAAELKDGVKKDGLWIKAISKAGGDKSRTESEYIKLRLQSLKDEMDIYASAQKAVGREETVRKEITSKKKIDSRENKNSFGH